MPAKRLRDSGGAKRDSKSTPVCILLFISYILYNVAVVAHTVNLSDLHHVARP